VAASPAPRRRSLALPGDPRVTAAIVGVIVVALVAVGLAWLVTRPSSTRPTMWQAITDQIQDGQVSKDTALQAFAYQFGVDLPGVKLPDGDRAADVPTDGSAAVRWVQRHWDELSAAQQAVVNRFITAGPNDRTVTIDGASIAAAGAPVAAMPLARPVPPAPVGANAAIGALGPASAASPPDTLVTALKNDLLADVARIGPKLGMPVIQEGIPLFSDITLTVSEQDGGNTLMQTFAKNNGLVYTPCNVFVYSNAWSNAIGITPALHVLLTHEVVHCYQNVIWASVPVAQQIPSWVTEGSALWLAANDTGITESMVGSQWTKGWFGRPERVLTDRTYDSFGWYSLLDFLGRNLWTQLPAAWRAAAASANDRSGPVIATLNGDGTDVAAAYAPSIVNHGAWKDPWITHGFGIPDGATGAANERVAAAPPGSVGVLKGRSAAIDHVTASDGEVVEIVSDGIASVHEAADGGQSDVTFASMRFCTKGDCICPPGTREAGQKMADADLRIPFTLAVYGLPYGSHYSITGLAMDDLCKQEPTPRPSGPPPSGGGGGGGSTSNPCGSGCGGSNGDPHLVTVDQHRYDFQAAGEFVLLRAPDGSVEVQARQEPYEASRKVAINTAIAVRAGGHRVVVAMSAQGLVASVDGTAADVGQSLDVAPGVRVTGHPRGIEITTPDGTTVWALNLGRYGINVQISASAALRASGQGLLGPVLPGGYPNVPLLPDGTRLPRPTDAHEGYSLLYGRFADAWRVTDQGSLFDYAAGTSTGTYAKPGFPAEADLTTVDTLTQGQRDAGQQACSTITDEVLHEQCVFDVAITGDPGFTQTYIVTQDLRTGGAATLASPAPVLLASPTPPPTISGGSGGIAGGTVGIVLTGVAAVKSAALAPDGSVLAMSIEGADGTWGLVTIDPHTGAVLKRIPTEWGGTVAFAAGSLWAGDIRAVTDCSISRIDPATLTVQAVLPSTCSVGGTTFVASGDAIWAIDRTGADIDAHGGHLRRIDPATNTFTTAVDAPTVNAYLLGAPGVLVLEDQASGAWALPAGATTFTSLGGPHNGSLVAARNGMWEFDNGTARFYADMQPSASVPVDGTVIAADDDNLYAAIGGPGADALWRYPADGSNPVQIGTAGADHEFTRSYFDNDPVLLVDGLFVKVWVAHTGPDTGAVAIQAVVTH
jgi:hypothetical protein